MPDTKIVRVYFEGNDDRAFLQGLAAAGLLPENAELAKQGTAGKDALVKEAIPFIHPENGVGGNAIVLVDLDDLSPEQRAAWFQKQLEQEIKSGTAKLSTEKSSTDRVVLFTLSGGTRRGRAVLVSVGLRGDADLYRRFGIQQFAIDDYVLRLAQEKRVYDAVGELREVSYEVAFTKLDETATLLRGNNIEVRHSKRFLHLLRAVSFFRPGSATLIERLLEEAATALSKAELQAVFHPLVADLHEASRLLA